MMKLGGEEQNRALELQIVDAERQRGRQNLDEQLRAVLRLRRDEQPVFSHGPHFALDSIQGAEIFC